MEATLRSSASASFTLADLNQHRPTPSYDHPPSSPKFSILSRVPGRALNRYDYLRGPKEIDEKLMRSETPAGTRPRSMHQKQGALT
jgi:hypothetical protein